MDAMMNIFKLLLKKNFLVRKKHWGQCLIVQIVLTLLILALVELVRRESSATSVKVMPNNTYHNVENIGGTYYTSTRIRFTPQTSTTEKIMESVKNCFGDSSIITGCSNEKTMLAEFAADDERKDQQDFLYSMGIVFDISDEPIPKIFKYKLRPSYLFISDNLYDPMENGGRGTFYASSLSIDVQVCLDKAYINMISKDKNEYNTTLTIQQMPYPPYNQVGPLTNYINKAFGIVIAVIFLIVTLVEITFPANEKIIGINILMSVNGVKDWMNLLSWLVSGILSSIIYLVLITLMLEYSWDSSVESFLQYSNGIIVFFALLLMTIHTFCFGYHLSSYLQKPWHGVFVILIPSIGTLVLHYNSDSVPWYFVYLGIISPNFLVAGFFQQLTGFETELSGLKWSNIFQASSFDTLGASVGTILIFSILGSLFHFFMALYVHAILPGKYGVKQNLLYCFQRKNKIANNKVHLALEENNKGNKKFEVVPEGSLEPGIQIRGLKKSYTTQWNKKTAVHALRGVSIDFYKSQITALLGHNGAGKTTMMSILSGLISSTEGVVYIDGENIQADPEIIKKNIGLCPQVNIVFPDLNVFEQLVFFGTLKADNKSIKQLEEEIKILLSKVNLSDKKYALPDQLSGGQKRRLCLAMAVIGDANVLILDEPTSGMDAESKREVWDIILKMRGYKTILISTHDMEEADILGDRIAIMHSGQLKSYGTAMFLKNLYGDGQVEVTLSVDPGCNVAKISEEIEINVTVLSERDGKIVLAIPKTASLPEALDKLESSKKKLGITGMSVSIITLEQVFLKTTEDEGHDTVDTSNESISSFSPVKGFSYFTHTFWGYWNKKFTFTKKNPWIFWISIILPLLAVLFFLPWSGEPELDLTLNAYTSPSAFVQSVNPLYTKMYQKTLQDFKGTASSVDTGMSVTGALLNFAKKNKADYRSKFIVSAEITEANKTIHANGFYSGSAIRGIPSTINCISNTLAKVLGQNEDLKIYISTQKLPNQFKSHSNEAVGSPVVMIKAALFTALISVLLTLSVTLYVIHPLSESVSGIKQLQDMTGASKLSYWGSMIFFDIVQYMIPIVVLVVSLVFIDKLTDTRIYHFTEVSLLLILLMLFGLSYLSLVYTISFFKFTQNVTMIILIFLPVIASFANGILSGINEIYTKKYDAIYNVLNNILLLIPHRSFFDGCLSFYTIAMTNAQCRSLSDEDLTAKCILNKRYECCMMECVGGSCKNPKSYFDSILIFLTLKESMMFLIGSCLFFLLIMFVLEQQTIGKIIIRMRRKEVQTSTLRTDELVQKEKIIVKGEIKKRVDDTVENDNDNVFLAHELKKNYGKLQVVKGISFRVKEGECFGLLGVNGAGKSTTFKMLTGIELPHDGTMYLKNYGIHDNRGKYLAEMGYCPQQDAIIDTLNAWDHLNLFARLRGVPKSQIQFVVRNWITKLNLTACASQPSATYSGGNKRRLNIAMALIGNPALVLMDEPTTGVDPAARRSLWNTLKACQEFGQSIILTSHSMEECEVLCNRLVIMVKGQIVCVGAVQELKQRFGAGYNIHVKLSTVSRDDDIQEIKRRIESGFSCQKMDENSGFLGYHVTDSQVSWTFMYDLMNSLKNTYSCIEDFAVLSSTLEQLFIQFARAPDDIGNGELSRNSWRDPSSGSPV